LMRSLFSGEGSARVLSTGFLDVICTRARQTHLIRCTALVTANNLRTASMVTLEDLAIGAFLALPGFFLVDLHCFVIHREWTLFHGNGSFGQWSQPRETRSAIVLHAAGMLAWMFIVVHQLRTKGRGVVHCTGVPATCASLTMICPAVVSAKVPSIHMLVGLSCTDLTLPVDALGILIEMVISVAKA